MEDSLLSFVSALFDDPLSKKAVFPTGSPANDGERALILYVKSLVDDDEALADDIEEMPADGEFAECPPWKTVRQSRADNFLRSILMDPAYCTTASNLKTLGGLEAMRLGDEVHEIGIKLAELLDAKNKTTARVLSELKRLAAAGKNINAEIRRGVL